MTITKCFVPLLAALWSVAGLTSLRAEWSFAGLGTLGGDHSSASAVSADGSVAVGWNRNADGDPRAFRWQDGAMAVIGDSTGTYASAVSADGSVVIIHNAWQSFRWVDGVAVELPTGPLTNGIGLDVSADGSVVVARATTYVFDRPLGKIYVDAAVWGPPDDEGNYAIRALRGLNPFENRPDSASAISSDGSVIVGRAENASGHSEAVRWYDDGSKGQIVPLGTLGGPRSAAYDVSADGSVIVGWAERADGAKEAFRWEGGVMSGLGLLPGDWEESFAYGVSADGSVVVGYALQTQPGEPSLGEPFVWDQTHGMQSLSALLTQRGVDLSDWDLTYARGISADGRVIVGNGYHISADRQEGWIATIPEPSTLTGLLSMALAAVFVYLRRHRKRHAC